MGSFYKHSKEIFLNAEIVVDRFHFFNLINRELDNQRKFLRKNFKENEELKNLKYLLLKPYDKLKEKERKKLKEVFKIFKNLEEIHSSKESLRNILEEDINKKEALKKIDIWKKKAIKINNKFLNKFLESFEKWKHLMVNYFNGRFTTSP